MNEDILSEKIVLVDLEVKTKEEALIAVSDELLKKDLVTEDFLKNLLLREEKYPTGLSLSSNYNVAIPHTDAGYVKRNQIALVRLKTPVIFEQMADKEKKVPVSFIVVLALKEPHKQLTHLQDLMMLFSDNEKMTVLSNLTNKEKILAFFKENGL